MGKLLLLAIAFTAGGQGFEPPPDAKESPNPEAPARFIAAHEGRVDALAISESGRYLLSSGEDGTLKLWNTDGAYELDSAKSGRTRAVTFSPDGRFAASAGEDGRIKLWKMPSLQGVGEMAVEKTAANSLFFSPDSELLASAMDDGSVIIWKAAFLRRFQTFTGSGSRATCAVFSPDGKIFVSCSEDGKVTIREPLDWSVIRTIKEKHPVRSAVFAAGGRLVYACGGEVKTPAPGGQAKTIIKGMPEITALAASGDYLLSFHADGSVRISDTRTRQLLWRSPRIAKLTAAAISGRLMAFGGAKGVIACERLPVPEQEIPLPPPQPAAQLKKLKPFTPPSTEPQAPEQVIALKTMGAATVLAVFAYLAFLYIKTRRKSLPLHKKSELVRPEKSSLIAGKYEIGRLIGKGGMAKVYEAVDTVIGKRFALKKLHEDLLTDEREKNAFLEEARITAKLKHPNIVDIYTVIEHEGGIYIVFEYVEGETLAALISRLGRLPAKECLAIGRHILAALKYAHSQGVTHRDLKPSNIIAGQDGYIRVMDFGIARSAKDTAARRTMLDISGTLAYMAPEQHMGRSDARSDIYSFGITFYEMASGTLPFKGPDFLTEKRANNYALPEGLPQNAAAVLARCLEPEPENRFQSATEVLSALNI